MKKDKTDDIIELALERYARCIDAEQRNRELAIEDLRFANGEQWPEHIKKERDSEQRPCLTINRTQRYIKQVVNDIRQVRPAIKTRPVDSVADPETAEVMNGMIKAIEQSCNAEIAYDWATESAVTMGWGYFRITCDYTDPESFEKDIIIKRVANPFAVYLDPDRDEPDGSDAKYGFVVDTMPRDSFEEQYPEASSEWSKEGELGTGKEGWFTEDTVRVAEYWCLEEKAEKLSQLPDGSLFWGEIEGAIAVRDSVKTTLVQRIITGQEVLEENSYPWKYIPIIPVIGEEANIEGETLYKGLVRDLKDPARLYNYSRSAAAERTALSPKAPWTGPKGAFKNPKWRTANSRNHPYLEWDTEAVQKAGGHIPKRTDPPQLDMGLIQEIQHASQEFKDVSGIYDAGLGDRSNEVSGTAINARKVQSDIANFHFVDNLARAMRHAGRVILNMIPTIYSEERIVRILKPNGDEETVKVNGQYIDPKTQKAKHFDLKAGRYDIAVDIGPSYATQRQEAVESMLEVLKAFPQAATVMGDLLAKNMDWPEADEFAKRLKLLLPASIAAEENPEIRRIQQNYEQTIQQGKQYIGMLENTIQDLSDKLSDKDKEISIKLGDLKRKIAKDRDDAAIALTELELEYNHNVPGAAV